MIQDLTNNIKSIPAKILIIVPRIKKSYERAYYIMGNTLNIMYRKLKLNSLVHN